MKNLVSTDWLEKNLENVRVLDASWHMPSSNRNAKDEFAKGHIKNSLFFDLDKKSCQRSSLPHMLPSNDAWEKSISNFGIKNSDHVVVYDRSDIISSCRAWYNFLFFNHNPYLISVLDGGFKKWIKENRKITQDVKIFNTSDYRASRNSNMVLTKNQVDINIKNKNFELIDARAKSRFDGLQPEPRKELKSGHIENSKNLPFTELVDHKDSTIKNKEDLIKIFERLKLDPNKGIAFTCGSGVTACILGLANSIITGKNPVIYDGSWSEYGLK